MQEHIGGEFKDIVLETTYMDLNGNLHKINNEEQKFSYRNSIFSTEKYIIVSAKLKLKYGNKTNIKVKMLILEKKNNH